MMNVKDKENWTNWLYSMFREFLQEIATQPKNEIVDIYECKKQVLLKLLLNYQTVIPSKKILVIL